MRAAIIHKAMSTYIWNGEGLGQVELDIPHLGTVRAHAVESLPVDPGDWMAIL